MRYLRSHNFNHLAPDARSRFYRETPRPDGSLLREYDMAKHADFVHVQVVTL